MRFRRRSRSVLIVLFSVLGLSGALASLGATAGQAPPAGPGASLPLAFVTYVHQPYQESAARALIECIRTWGGEYRGSPVYVVVTDPGYLTRGLEDKTVMRVPLEVGEPVRSFPYAVKARAAAAVEGLVAGKVRSLAWFDPETLLFGPPKEMDLEEGIAAVVAPVQFINTGQPPEASVDAYWGGIYGRVGLDPAKVFTVETRVDRRTVRAYLNCGMLAVRPEKGLFREWAKVQDELLGDTGYMKAAITDPIHRTFLHQAVITSIIVARLKRGEIRFFSAAYNYPLYCHGVDFTPGTGRTYRVPADMRPAKLNDLVTVFYEGLFRQRPDWADLIPPAGEPLRSWLRDLVETRLGGKR
ncbi:MAG: hypothetical protein HGA24_02720 [Candidatus Aminicenantes bacterium]|nr:hypothetical protein [Candidatus Aminicenantes bacterium]